MREFLQQNNCLKFIYNGQSEEELKKILQEKL